MRRFHLGIYALFTSTLLVASCAKDEVVDSSQNFTQGEAICFDAAVDWPEDYIEGRGAIIEKENLTSFNVWATLNKDESVGGGTIEYFSDVLFSKQGTENRFASTTTYYWPGEGPTLDFVAVGGKPASGFVAGKTNDKVTSFTYTVPTDATQQSDVVVATPATQPGNTTAAVPLDFQHIMSAINVMIGTDMGLGTINSVTFTGIKNKGTYNVANPAWTIASDASTTQYPVTFTTGNSYLVQAKPTATTKINADNATMMLLPQTLSDDAAIEVSFTPQGSSTAQTLSAEITGEWVMGKAYNYILNINPTQELSLTVVVQDWEGVTIKNNFADDVSVVEGDEIKWTVGEPTIDGNHVAINPLSGSATFKFKIAGPMGGTWNAILVTTQGNPNAFTITPNQGAVGEEATVTITTNGENNTREANMAELRFVVQQGGKILPVANLTTSGENYIIVQNPAIN